MYEPHEAPEALELFTASTTASRTTNGTIGVSVKCYTRSWEPESLRRTVRQQL